MEIDYLLSFKDHPSFQNLSESHIKKFSILIKSNKKNKNKKIKMNDTKKSSSQVKEKIQISKDKIENKFSLLINKLDPSNIDKIIEEFISKFKDISEVEFITFQRYVYTRILKDNKFQSIYVDFFFKIKEILSIIFNYNEEHFISLIEYKFKIDYSEILCCENSELNDFTKELKSYDSEDNRINNLELIIKFIEKGYFNKNILDGVTNILLNSKYIPDIYKFVKNDYIKKIYNFEKYYELLKSKVNDNMDTRYKVILNSVLENFGIKYLQKLNERSDSITSNDNMDIDINYEIDLKTVESFEKFKSKIEIEIGNIIEEYLLIEDFEEINNYLENQDNVNNFMKELINYYFKNNLNNYEKFKSLFLNFRNNKIIKSDIMINSLMNILNSDYVFDYVNIEVKTNRLLEIFKILQINLNEEQDISIKKIISS